MSAFNLFQNKTKTMGDIFFMCTYFLNICFGNFVWHISIVHVTDSVLISAVQKITLFSDLDTSFDCIIGGH